MRIFTDKVIYEETLMAKNQLLEHDIAFH